MIAWAELRGVGTFMECSYGAEVNYCGNGKTKDLKTLSSFLIDFNITHNHLDDVRAALEICDWC